MKKINSFFAAAMSKMKSTAKDQKGATMVEYALMVALIAVVAITAVTTVGKNVDTKFNAVGTAIGG